MEEYENNHINEDANVQEQENTSQHKYTGRNAFIKLLADSFEKIINTVKKTGVKWTFISIFAFMVFVGGVRICTSDAIPQFIERAINTALDRRELEKAEAEKDFLAVQQAKTLRLQNIMRKITTDDLCDHASIQVFHDGTKSTNKKIDFYYAQLFVESYNDNIPVRTSINLEATALSPYYSWLANEPSHMFVGTIDDFKEVDVEMQNRFVNANICYIYTELFYDSDNIMFYILSFTWNNEHNKDVINENLKELKYYRNTINEIMQN